MSTRLWPTVALFVTLPGLRAQNVPSLAYALPAGGQQGTAFEVTLGGQFLSNVSAASVTGAGVEVTVGEHARPMSGAQAQQLRNRMQELQKQAVGDDVRQEMTDIRVKLLLFNAQRTISPGLAETVKLRVAVARGAATGHRELRVLTPQGLSNPLVFCVGQLPEFTEKETIDVVPAPAGQPVNRTQIRQPLTDMPVTLPATINGRIKPRLGTPQQQARAVQPFTPGDRDRYRFSARRGQELVIAVAARELVPYLADAVPGWFQAVLTLYDSDGHEVAYDDDYRFHPDPVIHYTVPKDGEYSVEIRDALYRGREDFVYRIAIGELPFITGIFPMGGRAHAKTKVEIAGWNLPEHKLTVDAKGKEAGIYPVSTRGAGLLSNALPFLVDTLPETNQKEGNDSPARAQRVKLPIIVNGRVSRPGCWSVYRFEGRAGQVVVAEVYARRIESPLDSALKLTDASGRQLAFNDDFDDKGEGLETHHADSRILTTLPANGAYFLYLGDMQGKGGPEYTYRLRIGPPRQDFDLRVTPSAINVAGGMTLPVTVYALRKDGFAGDIRLALKGAPAGFVLSGATIPAGQDELRLTLTAPPQARQQREPLTLHLEGVASIGGRQVTRQAVPADDRMQAFFYRHLVPAQELKVAVRRGGPLRASARIVSPEPLKLPSGGAVKLEVEVPLPPNSPIGRLQYQLSDPPDGVTLAGVAGVRNGAEIVLRCDASKAKPGLKGNLIVTVSGERAAPVVKGKPQANRQRVPLGTLPAIPFEIVRADETASGRAVAATALR
ncbi:MAG: PPC domain-containing protein [Bryobacteraceae bacterium]